MSKNIFTLRRENMFKEKIKALISKGSGEENNGNNKKKIENLVVFILI